MIDFIDKTSTQNGTDINRARLLAIQGFQTQTTKFNADGSIVETNSEGHTKTTTFDAEGNVTEVFKGNKTVTKKTTFNSDGSIKEELI